MSELKTYPEVAGPAEIDKYLSDSFLQKYIGKRPDNAGMLFDVVYLRTYSRYLEEKKRRETWDETCRRVVEYSLSLYNGTATREALTAEAEFMFDSMFNLRVLPAGRTMWVGGSKASYSHPLGNFNCSFVVIDELEALGDLFYLLLCGSGVGFRVLPEDVAKLPKLQIPAVIRHLPYNPLPKRDRIEHSKQEVYINPQNLQEVVRIEIGDSKEGWVESLRMFLEFLELGYVQIGRAQFRPTEIEFCYDSVRPQGERIRTFGGRAAGPKGMEGMYLDLEKILRRCSGCLDTVSAMDCCNVIALNVVVGGTRRSSQIALGSPEDLPFIDAKKNLFSDAEKKGVRWRVMSNNSVTFVSKPTREHLQEIFANILNNGEPGFFNLEAANVRRERAFGMNPCITLDTWITTQKGPRMVADLIDEPFEAVIEGKNYFSKGFWKTGRKKVFRLQTKEGYSLKLTADHKTLTERGWLRAVELMPGDRMIIDRGSKSWRGKGNRDEGWLLGNLLGDGCFSRGVGNKSDLGILRYWGETKEELSAVALGRVKQTVASRSDLGVVPHKVNGYCQIASTGLADLAAQFGMIPDAKEMTPALENTSREFHVGFLQGLFDADGCVHGNRQKGQSVRLSQSNLNTLEACQRMLLRLGIKSIIYRERQPAGMRILPDGKGGQKLYYCQASHELVVPQADVPIFAETVGFSDPDKSSKLSYMVEEYRTSRKCSVYATFESLTEIGYEDVYDCSVDKVHRFVANGLVAHNCSEILLDNRGVCNLSTVVLSSFVEDGKIDQEGALRAIRLATRIGLRQTNVTLPMPRWDEVQKRDRLTGVSMTGILDAFDALGWRYDDPPAVSLLRSLRSAANREADEYSAEMNVPRPVLVTALKPEGSLSQLPTVSSGMHRAYAPYFIRRIRVSAIDPVCKALQMLGVPNEPDHSKSDRIVFSFPIKSNATTEAADESALDQLRRYHILQRNYTDHNTSCTLQFAAEEVDGIIDEMLENWDDTIAIALLPKHTTAYPQLPYEAISKEEYEDMAFRMPSLSNLSEIVNIFEEEYEEDNDLDDPACAGGVCPVR